MSKILLVEDDKSLREIYGVRLSAEGYEIVAAGDGEEALAIAVKERPDLIISDVMMPKISGFDMLDILRATPETKDLKVIMMTALSSDDQRQRGESLGANRYLVKSQVGIEDIVRAVHEVLADTPVAQQPANGADFTNVQAPIERTEDSVPLGVAQTPTNIPTAASPAEIEAALAVAPPATEEPVSIAPPTTPAPPVETAPYQTPQITVNPESPAQPVPAPLPDTPAPVQVSAPPVVAQPATPTISTLPPEQVPISEAPISTYTSPIAEPVTQLPTPTAPFSTPAPESLKEQILPTAPPATEEPVPIAPPTTPPPVKTAPVQVSAPPVVAQPEVLTTPAPAVPTPFTPPQPLDHTDEPNYAQMLSEELDDTSTTLPPTPAA